MQILTLLKLSTSTVGLAQRIRFEQISHLDLELWEFFRDKTRPDNIIKLLQCPIRPHLVRHWHCNTTLRFPCRPEQGCPEPSKGLRQPPCYHWIRFARNQSVLHSQSRHLNQLPGHSTRQVCCIHKTLCPLSASWSPRGWPWPARSRIWALKSSDRCATWRSLRHVRLFCRRTPSGGRICQR